MAEKKTDAVTIYEPSDAFHKQTLPAKGLEVAGDQLHYEAPAHKVDAFIEGMEAQLVSLARPPKFFTPNFKDPSNYSYVMVIFASMGGVLIDLDDSLISGANL